MCCVHKHGKPHVERFHQTFEKQNRPQSCVQKAPEAQTWRLTGKSSKKLRKKENKWLGKKLKPSQTFQAEIKKLCKCPNEVISVFLFELTQRASFTCQVTVKQVGAAGVSSGSETSVMLVLRSFCLNKNTVCTVKVHGHLGHDISKQGN